jgi:hypothetical protein
MNQPENAAGTPEYAAFRAEYEPYLNNPPSEVETIQIGGEPALTAEVANHSVGHTNLINKVSIKTNGEIVFNYTIYDAHITLLNLIKHKNGREYLIFNRDLYGYSVMDVSSREVADYIPANILHGEEAFIWTGTLYCPHTNVLAVNGCYWAGPCGTEFYDFSDPMNLPFKFLGDSYSVVEAKYGETLSSDTTKYFDDGKWNIKMDDELCIDIDNTSIIDSKYTKVDDEFSIDIPNL